MSTAVTPQPHIVAPSELGTYLASMTDVKFHSGIKAVRREDGSYDASRVDEDAVNLRKYNSLGDPIEVGDIPDQVRLLTRTKSREFVLIMEKVDYLESMKSKEDNPRSFP